jgi:hypothetical protein
MFHHAMSDLHLLDCSSPTNIYNDNHGAIDWSNTFCTKGMYHMNIRENAVREAQVMNEVSIHHIPGSHNPADLFTKEFKSDLTFRTLRNLTLFYPSSFKANSLPCLDGGCQFQFQICFFPRSHSFSSLPGGFSPCHSFSSVPLWFFPFWFDFTPFILL